MKIIIKRMSIFILFILLTACNDNQAHSEKEAREPLKVEILAPNELSVGEAAQLQIKVTQGDKNVNDAEEVEFEIWKDGESDRSVMVPAKNIGDGIYEVNQSFDMEGTYYIQTHVTARSMHSMPKKQVVVGDVSDKRERE